jgi:hypothetical protein
LHYPSGKPFTRWWWFACDIGRDDITSQLEWLKAKGFGGVEIAWIYPLRGEHPWRRLFPDITPDEEARRDKAAIWLSREWTEDVAFAKAEATRLGLGCDFTFGTLWPFGDSHVSTEDASRQYTVDQGGNVVFELQEIEHSWERPTNGLVINHLDRFAFEHYAQRMGGALAPALEGAPSAIFCDSWEVRSDALWTDGFEEDFRNRYGYDIRSFMPGLWTAESDPDIRYDYLALLSDMIIDNFYRPFAEHARKLGAFSRVQVAGSPVDMVHAYSIIDVPETEAMLFEPAFGRIVSSAAVLGGRSEVSAESFTCIYGFPGHVPDTYHLREKVGDLKLVADALFAHGVNQIFWHGTPFTPAGAVLDLHFYATVDVGRHEGSLSKDLGPFNAYLERVSQQMKQGRTYSDVALWLPLEDGRMDRDYPEELQIPGSSHPYELRYVYPPEEVRGYHPLYVSNALLRDVAVRNGTISIGDAAFRALYVDVKYLAIKGLETLLRLAREGLPIVLKRTPLQPGRAKSPQYGSMIEQLRHAGATEHFRQAVPWPPLVQSADGERIPDYWARIVGTNDLLIFFAHPETEGLRIPVDYGRSSGSKLTERRVVISVDDDHQHQIGLRFAPNQSLLVRVCEDGVDLVDIVYHPPH